MLKTRSSRTETTVGSVILGILLIIVAGILVKQSHYDQALFKMATPQPAHSVSRSASTNGSLSLQGYLPPGFKPLTAVETFGPATLSDKIDGKAELYLSAGFCKLTCQRFAEAENSRVWLEILVYDMGSTRNAFAVYSSQRRADAQQVDFSPSAYRTANALYLVTDQNYVEIIASQATPNLSKAMLRVGRSFLSKHPGKINRLKELALFPKEHLTSGSIALLAANAFGFEQLNNIMTARYDSDSTQLTAFLSIRKTAREASALAAAYHDFLLQNGGRDASSTVPITAVKLVQIFDTFELIFTQGPILAGIHEADSQAAAERLALALQHELAEGSR